MAAVAVASSETIVTIEAAGSSKAAEAAGAVCSSEVAMETVAASSGDSRGSR